MRNPSAKKTNNNNVHNDKKNPNANNDFLKNEINKIMFKKGGSDTDKMLKIYKAKNTTNNQKNQTRNHTNNNNPKENESKYFSMKSNNLDTLDKAHQKENKEKKGKNFLTQKFNKPNILLFNQYNLQANDTKKISDDRAVTQPCERTEIVGYKSCGKNVGKKSINNFSYNLNNNLFQGNNNNFNAIANPKSVSKSPKRNHSSNVHHKNPEVVSQLEMMRRNQENQYQKLYEFYQKENEINKTYTLFNFPENSKTHKNNTKNNAQIPEEYFNDYLDTYCREEKTLEFKIKPNFMDNQIDINNRMRAIIVNWMIEVHDRFKLLPDTLFLSVIIFDRYMSVVNNIDKRRLQLVGVTSLLVACKYEEIFSPEIRDFVCILDRTYEREDLMEQENNILKVLKFEVTFPSSLRYYEILVIKFGIEEKNIHYGNYLLELCLLDCKFSKYSQGVIAITVCFFVLKLFQKVSFEKFMENYIKVSENEIKECLMDICFLIEYIDGSIYPAVNKKHKGVCNEIKKLIFKDSTVTN